MTMDVVEYEDLMSFDDLCIDDAPRPGSAEDDTIISTMQTAPLQPPPDILASAEESHRPYQNQDEMSSISSQQDLVADEQTDAEESSDDESPRLVQNSQEPRKISERKRRDAAVFQSWITQNQAQVTAASKTRLSNTESTREATMELMRGSVDKKIIHTPREYQVELFEKAKEKNIIVVLDTGSGKTLIAALLLRHTLDQELEDRAAGKSHRVAFFVVEKVALCEQQHAVLSDNLEHPTAKFHGDRSDMMRTKEYWDKQLSENMLIVCTAKILQDCLDDGLVRIAQVSLLVFDEAHHTKKNHPFAQIVKNHYLRESEESKRPRILGMTASPVDSQTKDLQAAARELETLLCSEIATVSDEVLLQSQARKQQVESVAIYGELKGMEDARTDLWTSITQLVAYNPWFKTPIEFSEQAASTLGPWCADRFWQLLITESEHAKIAARTSRHLGDESTSYRGEEALDKVKAVYDLVSAHEFKPLDPSADVSPKVTMLHEILTQSFVQKSTKRCIVFVEKRHTAFMLVDLFNQPAMRVPGMLVSYMVGSQPTGMAIANMSFRDQIIALNDFRSGLTNCLFATSVAEEGIDVPECDLIIRFDLYKSVIQYIQSKGRARQVNSQYISLLEEGNYADLRRSKQASRDANLLRRFCSALPVDRKIQDESNQPNAADEAMRALSRQRCHIIPSTGARLTEANSIEVLAKFVSSLPTNGEASNMAEYVINHVGKQFVAQIIFPESSPIRHVSGRAQRSKQLARGFAAFEACVMLINKKYINNHLQPAFAKKLPAMRNARLAVSENKKSQYEMRIKPSFWEVNVTTIPPTELFMTSIVLDGEGLIGSARPLALMTRIPFPDMPSIPLFLGGSKSTRACLSAKSESVAVTPEELDALTTFTLKIFTDLFSKDFDAASYKVPYFFAALTPSSEDTVLGCDWELMNRMQAAPFLEWRGQPETFYHDKLVIDPYDGSRKMIIHGINKSLRPSDPTPDNVPRHKSRGYYLGDPIIKEYSNSLWTKSRGRVAWSDDQPVVNADLLPLRRNLLDEWSDDQEPGSSRCYIILEPLQISAIPIEIVSMGLALPAILHRIESTLLALELCECNGLDVRADLALEAITKDSDNTGQHDEEQVNFQRGMGNNYERLEFLGDSFLKMATTISIFTLTPHGDEFEYHVERMVMICNQNLFNHAVDRRMEVFIRSKAFDRRTWYPPMLLRKGKALKTKLEHTLSQKSIADVCEALIGAAYLTGTDAGTGFDQAVKAVTVMVRNKNHTMDKFSDYYDCFKAPGWQSSPSTAAQRLAVDQVEKAVGYRFISGALLRSAFKHPSWAYESIPHYQRLEFLGDALLDMAIVDFLFRSFPDADPQWLTEHKGVMASNHFLGCLCVKLGLNKHILATNAAIPGSITEYVTELAQAEKGAQAEAKAQGKPMRQDFWLSASAPPKVLPDVVEAFVGAMFVDSQYDYAVVQRFFAAFVQPYFQDMALYDSFASRHPVSMLQRRLQTDFGCSAWRLCVSGVPRPVEAGIATLTQSDVLCALMVHEKVVEYATRESGRYGKVAVAKKGLERFAAMDAAQYRAEMGCDCAGVSDADDHGATI